MGAKSSQGFDTLPLGPPRQPLLTSGAELSEFEPPLLHNFFYSMLTPDSERTISASSIGQPTLNFTGLDLQGTKPTVPSGWDLRIHPQGWLYFHDAKRRVVAVDDVRDPKVLHELEEYLKTYPLFELDEYMEIMVPTGFSPDSHIRTLVVNHLHCAASYNVKLVKTERLPCTESVLVNRQRRLYWNYLQWHPCHVSIPKTAEREVRDALTWYHVDNLISGARSVVPFSRAECQDLLNTLDSTRTDHDRGARTVLIAWMLREIWSFRDAEDYGRFTSRQSSERRAQRLPAGPKPPPAPSIYVTLILDFVVDFFFFSIPRTYVGHVKTASEYHGRLANVQERWTTYIRRLVQEYQDFLLIATVLLSATIGFLDLDDLSTTAKAAGIVSVFAALGSVIMGVYFVWTHQTNSHRSTFAYLHNAHHGLLGLLGHGMYLSLPAVFLVWGVVAFAVAFIAYIVQGIKSPEKEDSDAAWASLGVSILVMVMAAAGLYTFWYIWRWRRQLAGRKWFRLLR